MKKFLKYLLIALGSLLVLLGGAAAIIAATFNPNDYKSLIIRQVQEKKQRTLAIPGDIKLTIFPKLGADLGKVSLSEHKSSAEFASIEQARVSLALIPLLSRQLVVDRIQIDGLRANLRRAKDGTTNIDDLLSKAPADPGNPDKLDKPADPTIPPESQKQAGGEAFRFDVDGVRLSNARLHIDDRMKERVIELDKLTLETGRLADNVDSKMTLGSEVKVDRPAVNAVVALNTGFRFSLADKRYTVKGMDGELKGSLLDFSDLVLKVAGDADLAPEVKRFNLNNIKLSGAGKQGADTIDARLDIPKLLFSDQKVEGGKLNGEVRRTQKDKQLAATFALSSFEGTPKAFQVPALSVDATLRDPTMDISAKITGPLSGDIDKLLFTSPQLGIRLAGKKEGKVIEGSATTALSADMEKKLIDLPKLALQFALPTDGGSLALKGDGRLSANLARKTMSAALKGTLDQSAFDARVGMTSFSPAALSFDIGIDRLDLDRYQGRPSAAATQTAKPEPAKSEPAKPEPAGPQARVADEKPLDLSALKTLRADGALRIGSFKIRNLSGSNLRAELHARDGEARVNPIAADLYGGRLAGNMSIAATVPARMSMRQNLSAVNLGPLLKDFTGKNTLEGRGSVQLDVNGTGDTVARIKRGLNGTARMELKDGAVRGVNVAQVIRNAKAAIGEIRGGAAPQTGTSSEGDKTDFSELTASARITNGVARNDDLLIKSPLLRIGGSGDVDLGADKLDYLLKATVVSTLQGQGGPELDALKGLTVPVKLSGPFTALQWRIDFAGMAGELAKQKVDEKKEEIRSRAEKAIDEQKNKMQEKLQDKLKGLFGR
jgi:AsmA protein